MNLVLRTKLLLLSGAVALGSLTAAAPAAHAVPGDPRPITSAFKEQLSITTAPDCSSVPVTGDGFYGPALVSLYYGGTSYPGGSSDISTPPWNADNGDTLLTPTEPRRG